MKTGQTEELKAESFGFFLFEKGSDMKIEYGKYGMIDLELTIANIKNQAEELTVGQLLELRKLELLEEIALELRYMNELKERE